MECEVRSARDHTFGPRQPFQASYPTLLLTLLGLVRGQDLEASGAARERAC